MSYCPFWMSGLRTSVAEQRQRGLDSVDDELVERPAQPHQALVAGPAMDDQLADQRVVVRRDAVALVDGRIDAHAEAAGRMEIGDPAGRGPEGRGVLGVDAALDGVAVELTSSCAIESGAPAAMRICSLHEVDAGDHLGHRMLDLDAGVHLDEVELAVLVEELDRAGADIAELLHGLGDDAADALAHLGVERRGGAFLPDLLVAALQRAVALAEMHGVALAVAEHLDLDVARLLEILLEIDRVVAERGLGLGPGGLRARRRGPPRCARPSCRVRRRRPPP